MNFLLPLQEGGWGGWAAVPLARLPNYRASKKSVLKNREKKRLTHTRLEILRPRRDFQLPCVGFVSFNRQIGLGVHPDALCSGNLMVAHNIATIFDAIIMRKKSSIK
jgi:hypothetical protein